MIGDTINLFPNVNSAQQYIDLYHKVGDALCQDSHPLLNTHRAKALAYLEANGLPSKKAELYRYTDVQEAFSPDYGLNLNRLRLPFNPKKAYHCAVPNMGSTLVYQINDMPEIAGHAIEKDGVFLGSLRDFASSKPDAFTKYYNKLTATNGISALNTLFCQDGLVVYITKGHKPDNPLQIVNLTAGSLPLMANRRMLVILEDGAEASLLVCDHSATDALHLSTEVCEVYMGAESRLQYYSVEETAPRNRLFASTTVRQGRGSSLDYACITLRNGLTRHTVDIRLEGDDAHTQCSGLVIADGAQHADNNLLVTHNALRGSSDILYKYVLDGEARGAFAGKVLVKPGAQKTDSLETNANLCLSPRARMYTQPMLEIYADDVKCNHGSTVGQLDEQQLFYMSQRGISPDEGRRLLQQAFALDVINRIQLLPLRARLSHMVEERFQLGSGSCGDCPICSPNT